MVAKCFKKILLLLFITGAIQANAQEGKKSELQQWKDFIENARLIARQERHLMDSIVHIKAENALQRKEFVLESDELTLKHGEHGYVNSTTNFIALHDGRATVQISPFQSGGGPNGVGGYHSGRHSDRIENGNRQERHHPPFHECHRKWYIGTSYSDTQSFGQPCHSNDYPQFQFSQCYIGRATGSVQGKFRI